MSEAYARSLCKVVVAQLVKALGFTSISHAACEALTDIIKLYIEEIGTRAHSYSELACRTDSNFHDVRQAFTDMSVDMNDLSQYLLQADEIPFAKTFTPFPIPSVTNVSNNNNNNTSSSSSPLHTHNKKSTTTDNDQDNENNEEKEKDTKNDPNNNNKEKNNEETTSHFITKLGDDQHNEFPPNIPSFLPKFPDRHTFSKTPLYGEVITDPNALKKTKNKQKRKVEKNLIKLSSITTPTPITSYDLKNQKTNNNNNNNNEDHQDDQDNDTDNDFVDNRLNKQQPPQNSGIAPTPLHDINSTYFAKHDDMGRRNDELPRRGAGGEEDNERAKKRQKSERILALTHDNSSSSSSSSSSAQASNQNPSTPNL
ncbi:hypothetical protein DFA_01294 [Cavenderia fasciculata]|uniref:Transcription initiation factor TFIID subunit 8 n=1 Tax=Cavenderia fasciculata TaxID=261658 RepID=F4PRX4_CACFS|nr:uncharacterized protein DFA_01294 [Cavenderia fasciculata]EGG21410.1 hypothetical protein DFA_01294 [Cavenderia fasciculata]|eukprot:XP_004359260.1 hypothetical protein DFA_01294 [Cavenderia fasciculata]